MRGDFCLNYTLYFLERQSLQILSIASAFSPSVDNMCKAGPVTVACKTAKLLAFFTDQLNADVLYSQSTYGISHKNHLIPNVVLRLKYSHSLNTTISQNTVNELTLRNACLPSVTACRSVLSKRSSHSHIFTKPRGAMPIARERDRTRINT